MLPSLNSSPKSIEWRVHKQPMPYMAAVEAMEQRVDQIINHQAPEMIWLLEHPPLYTAGTSARSDELINKAGFPVYPASRGGRYTYHGPGQRVVYCLLDLRDHKDIRLFIHKIEQWIITSLAQFSLQGFIRDDRVGVWIVDPNHFEKKIAAIGIRVRKWVTFHGFSININPDLSHFREIIPCGLNMDEYGITSLKDQGLNVTTKDLDAALHRTFQSVFTQYSKPITP